MRRAEQLIDTSCIYRLIDPKDSSIRYVGITNDPQRRFEQHLQCDGSNPWKDTWIQELHQEGLTPAMELIEVTLTREEGLEREHYWIEYYLDNGAPLTNIQFASYLTSSVLWNALDEEQNRPQKDDFKRWVERTIAQSDSLSGNTLREQYKKSMSGLLKLIPEAVNGLVELATIGTPSVADRAVRCLVTNIRFVAPYIRKPQIVNLSLWD